MPIPNGAAIRAIRLAQGWKGTKLAAAVGISHSHLANIENPNRRKSASAEVLRRLADTLNVPLAAVTSDHSVAEIAGVSGRIA